MDILVLVGKRASFLNVDPVKSYSPMKGIPRVNLGDSLQSIHFGQEILDILPDSFLEVALPRKSSITGLLLHTHKDQFFEEFGLSYQRLSFNSPNSWTQVEWGLEPMVSENFRCPYNSKHSSERSTLLRQLPTFCMLFITWNVLLKHESSSY